MAVVAVAAVAFRLLGEVEAEIDGRPVALGHARQRCVLAVLLVEANHPVSLDQLADRVWEDRLPQRARATLYGYLSRLRRLLTPADGAGIVRRTGGYTLTVDPMAVDLHRFRRLVAGARAADRLPAAAERLQQALALWRGEAFAGLHTSWLDALRGGANQERLAAELDRNDLALELGRHAELLPDLFEGVAAYPLDERLAGQLMLALYRDGRPADALRCFAQLRQRLIDELGVDPGSPLRQLHRQILTADPALAGPVRATGPGPPPVPRQLPAPPSAFVGRTDQLAVLSAAANPGTARPGPVVISAIGGAGGIGKTWLALQWAHQQLDRFPDGQLYVNLRGFDPAGEPVPVAVALCGFLDALGVASAAVPADQEAQAALYRSLTARRRMLIVLDNARDSAQVVPLLPGSPTCTVLVTSRHSLPGLVTAHGARPLVLDVLTEAEARQLLVRQLGQRRVAAEPAAVSTLVRHCAGLPLALGVVAARAALRPELALAVLAKELHDASTRLDALDAGELSVNLRSVLGCSYGALTAEAARVFGLLGLMPGPDIGLPAAASLTSLPSGRCRSLLRELGTAHLVCEHLPGRYRMHDLVRLYAAELATATGEAAGGPATQRVLDHYLHTACAADRALDPHREPLRLDPARPGVAPEPVADHAAALAWFTAEHAALVAAVAQAAAGGCEPYAWRLAWALKTFFDIRGHWHDQAATQRIALRAAQRLADPAAQAHAHRGLGLAYVWLRRFDEAGRELRQALERSRERGDLAGQAQAHRGLARAFAQQGHHGDALPHDERALGLYRAVGNPVGEAVALNAVGWHRAHLGQPRPALADCQRALRLYRRLGDRRGEAATWDSLGYIRRQLGDHRQAIVCYRRALALFREVGDRYFEGEVLASLGDAQLAAGAHDLAGQAWRQALGILDELGHPTAERVRAALRRDCPAS